MSFSFGILSFRCLDVRPFSFSGQHDYRFFISLLFIPSSFFLPGTFIFLVFWDNFFSFPPFAFLSPYILASAFHHVFISFISGYFFLVVCIFNSSSLSLFFALSVSRSPIHPNASFLFTGTSKLWLPVKELCHMRWCTQPAICSLSSLSLGIFTRPENDLARYICSIEICYHWKHR